MRLYDITQNHLELLNDIEAAEGILDEELTERLKISEDTFKEKAEQYCKMIAQAESEAIYGQMELKRISQYVKVKTNIIERLKDNLLSALRLFGAKDSKKDIWRVEVGTFKLSTRQSVSTIIDEEEIEDRFKEISMSKLSLEDKVKILDVLGKNEEDVKVTISIPKTPVKEAIESGEDVKGAYLSTNYLLTIK